MKKFTKVFFSTYLLQAKRTPVRMATGVSILFALAVLFAYTLYHA